MLEPPPAIPAPAARAPARGVVALREPLAPDAVRDVVLDLAAAWQRASLEGLVSLLTADAGPLGARARGRGPLVEGWRQRLHAHEYARAAGLELVRPERVLQWSYDELGVPGAPSRPAEMRPDELYVRVPMEVTQVAGDRLFDDVLVLLLRREEGRYRIAAYAEESAH